MTQDAADPPTAPSRALPHGHVPAIGTLRLKLLGRMEAFEPGGTSVLPRVRKTRAVLALLAMAGGQPVMRLSIAGLLWSTRDKEQARASLRQSVHELTECLAPAGIDIVVAERTHLQLRNEAVDSDVRAVTRATVTRPEPLDLLKGAPLLEDLVGLDPLFDRWLVAERQKLAAGATIIAEAVLDAALRERAPTTTILAAAQRLLAIDPLRESGWRAAMEAYRSMGDRASAMDAFERCAATLAETAHLSPSSETRDLYDLIRADRPTASSRSDAGAPDTGRRLAVAPAALGRGVRLGVMPFRVLGPGGDDGLSIGLADEITTALSRFRWIFLIASPSLAALQSGTSEQRIGMLHLDFLLEGTVQRDGDRVRVTARLLDMHSAQSVDGKDVGGEVVWARRFDRAFADLFSLQDEVAAETVAQVDPELLLREAHRATALPPSDPSAYELMLRAIPALYRLEERGFKAAEGLLEAAIARDRNYAPAYAWLAYWHLFLIGQGWASDVAASMSRAGDLADQAVALDPSDARALTIAGHIRSYLDHQMEDAIKMHERALALNPNLPLVWAFSGLAHAYIGRHDEAIRRIGQARRLSPFDPHGFFFDTALMVPTLMQGQFEMVVELGRRATHLNPTLVSTLKGYLCALGHIGPSSELLAIRAKLLQGEPGFSIRQALARTPLQTEHDRALYAAGLRRAGIPESQDRSTGSGFVMPPAAGPGWAIT